MSSLANNLVRFQNELRSVCENCGRDPAEIQLVAVSKNHSAAEVNELLKAGVVKIGENRLQEALDKFPDLLKCEKHFIGHIQSNKAREIAQNFDVVQSVGSLKVARILNEPVESINPRDISGANSPAKLPIFLQVNLAHESQKSGFLENELADAVKAVSELSRLELRGLMVMGILGDLEKTREVFARAKELNDGFRFGCLSAGMSGDWEIAVAEGATHLRVGGLLFG